MSLKEILKSKKKELVEQPPKDLEEPSIDTLDKMVEHFLSWYYENMVKEYYIDNYQYRQVEELKSLIEKLAIWYERRCQEFVSQESNREWEKFHNFDFFLTSLSSNEKLFFQDIPYRELVYLNLSITSAHLHLDKDGYVEIAEGVSAWLNYKKKDRELEGVHIKRIVEMLKQEGFPLPSNNELEEAISRVEDFQKLRNGILDCVMYRVIERGGPRIGPRRGFLFAKEFKRNIDIPMMYGVDTADPDLRRFTNEYLKAGGSKELVCYENYFSREDDYQPLLTTTVSKILDITDYTEEENGLQQRLVNILSSQINPESLKKEKVKQLRIERKLEKSRR